MDTAQLEECNALIQARKPCGIFSATALSFFSPFNLRHLRNLRIKIPPGSFQLTQQSREVLFPQAVKIHQFAQLRSQRSRVTGFGAAMRGDH